MHIDEINDSENSSPTKNLRYLQSLIERKLKRAQYLQTALKSNRKLSETESMSDALLKKQNMKIKKIRDKHATPTI